MINYISKPFKWFFKLEAASGLILLFAAIVALIISNSDLAELYFSTLDRYLFLGINNFGLNHNFKTIIKVLSGEPEDLTLLASHLGICPEYNNDTNSLYDFAHPILLSAM